MLLKVDDSVHNFYVQGCHLDEMMYFVHMILVHVSAKYRDQNRGTKTAAAIKAVLVRVAGQQSAGAAGRIALDTTAASRWCVRGASQEP